MASCIGQVYSTPAHFQFLLIINYSTATESGIGRIIFVYSPVIPWCYRALPGGLPCTVRLYGNILNRCGKFRAICDASSGSWWSGRDWHESVILHQTSGGPSLLSTLARGQAALTTYNNSLIFQTINSPTPQPRLCDDTI